jgi:Flp pilus assembly protein TadG
LVSKLLRDQIGSVLVEATIAFPLLLIITLGTIDFTYMLYEWDLASKAAYRGARMAVVTDPVATGITSLTWNGNVMGDSCLDPATGSTNGNCPTVTTVCTPSSASTGTCTDGSTFDATAFKAIFDPASTDITYPGMQQIFPRLQPQNVQISYQTSGLGFVGRPNGLPMEVTVSIRCMTHQFYFIGALMGWLFSSPSGCDPAPAAGLSIPAFASTLPSEGMGSDGS